MAKLVTDPLASLASESSAVTTLGANYDAIETAFENTLSRDGTAPNAMEAALDMNGNNINNAGVISATTFVGDFTSSTNIVTTVSSLEFASITALRAYAVTPLTYGTCRVTAYTAGGLIGGGFFWYDSGDTTSADDNGKIIVDALNRRWKRLLDNNKYESAHLGGSTDYSDVIRQATVVGGTADAITLTFSPPYTSLVRGQRFRWFSSGSNTTTTPTVTIDGLAVQDLNRHNSVALAVGDIPASDYICEAVYTGYDVILLNPLGVQVDKGNVFTIGQTIRSTDAGSTYGPDLYLERLSATPANSDELGAVHFAGQSSTLVYRYFARILSTIKTVTNTLEDGLLNFKTILAGTLADRLIIGAGVYTPNATGGDKGIDTINTGAFYTDGYDMGRTKIKLSDQPVNNSTTLVPDDTLLFPIAASGKYSFEMKVFYTSNTTPDFKFELDSTAATDPTSISIINQWCNPNNSDYTTYYRTKTSLNSTISPLSINSGLGLLIINGVFTNGADSGNFRLQWAQNTADASDTKVLLGSSVTWRKIA